MVFISIIIAGTTNLKPPAPELSTAVLSYVIPCAFLLELLGASFSKSFRIDVIKEMLEINPTLKATGWRVIMH
jgi:hypothetical protein